MKIFSRFFQWIISSTLVILGFSSCETAGLEMYGTPTASYSIKAKVLDNQQKPIPEIKVRASIVLSNDMHFPIDSVHTNAIGEALFEFREGLYQEIKIECEDIDGDTNGSFEDKTVIVKFENSDYKGGDDNWNMGKAEKDIIIEMDTKELEE